MTKVGRKNTDYYKSGRHKENATASLKKATKRQMELRVERITAYNTDPIRYYVKIAMNLTHMTNDIINFVVSRVLEHTMDHENHPVLRQARQRLQQH